ncbi:hypothetical protein PLICRDRAFT_44566 [Plicaturopsis crispa FD-325 SS-3]|nr:hypothetical protein PLICRDRAFT_44566 [Plicaturopsis crispa FD-325 SS-3]
MSSKFYPVSLETGTGLKRQAPKTTGIALLLLTVQSLGIIYSDIGTSPLYVLNGIWPASGLAPSKEDVIGGISAIIWSITLLALIKYVIISLYFGTTEGEGGTFALFQGLYPPEDIDFDCDRTLTGDSYNKTTAVKSDKYRLTKTLRWPLLVWCLFGTSLTIADGIFTPAVSVTSAVAGIAIAKPSIIADVTPISIALLVVLFIAQRFGTAKLAVLFAPIALIWFVLLFATGIYNITFYPGIFRAFDPSRAIMLFVRTGNYDLLAGVLLALTGCEAVFANLGQFNALSIRISFTGVVYPSLCLAYLGQGARLIDGGDTVLSNIFYQTIPGPTGGAIYWIVFVFAILATIIASQSMITATFSLVQQIVNLNSLPSIRLINTSETHQGQIYVPTVNWTLMALTIIVVAAFKSSTALSNAYGFSVATVMFSTSILLAIQMRYVKQLPIIVGLAYFIVYGFLDGLFWGAALKKVPEGAWVPLMIGVILMLFMTFWTWAKGLEDEFDGAHRKNLRHIIHVKEKSIEISVDAPLTMQGEHADDDIGEDDAYHVHPSKEATYYLSKAAMPSASGMIPTVEKTELARVDTCAIFHKLSKGKGVPHTFTGFLRQWPALPRVVIFLSVCVLPLPRVASEDRYVVSKARSVEGFYGVTYYLGFRDKFDVKIEEIIKHICTLEIQADPHHSSRTVDEIKRVSATATHLVPHYHVVSKPVHFGRASAVVNYIRTFLVEELYHRLAIMFPETANWLTSADEIIYVGVNAPI